ncbi:MAG: hypothetical protein SCM11_05670 [Bacillota bacterium]|nr:hypothetical protein [Bacillota bacterium]
MKKYLISVILILLLSLSGCTTVASNKTSVQNPADGLLTVDLALLLAKDRNKLVDIPWFSPPSVAVNALKIERERIVVISFDSQAFEFAVPVFVMPFEQRANMVFRFVYDDDLNDGEGALHEVFFDFYADDEDAYRTLLEQFSTLADRPELPFTINDDEIERAVRAHRSISTVSSITLMDEDLDRRTSQNFHVTAGDFARNDDIAQAFGNPIAVRISLWISVY